MKSGCFTSSRVAPQEDFENPVPAFKQGWGFFVFRPETSHKREVSYYGRQEQHSLQNLYRRK
jgi:hypothetical protein